MSESPPATLAPPTTLRGRLRHIGPGIIISASIVGSGELIITTKLGAEAGFILLGLVIFSCLIKVFLQVELGRYVVSSGQTTLEAFDGIPGPRCRAGWLVWLWAIMACGTILQLSGIFSSLVSVFALRFADVSPWVWAAAIVAVTAGFLATGRYRHVEISCTVLVVLFTAITVIGSIVILSTENLVIDVSDIAKEPPREGQFAWLLTGFAAFGVTGVGASELVYYPYWCLEKGYARYTGRPDGSEAWLERARGWVRVMHVDAWVSCGIYTIGTIAFFYLGASVLHPEGIVPQNDQMHDVLSRMYVASFGEASGVWLYIVGAFAVLFSTFFVATASNTRLFTNALEVFRIAKFDGPGDRLKSVRAFAIGIPLFCCLVWVVFPDKPVTLILIGAVAQGAMLSFIAVAAVYLRYRRTAAALAPRSWLDVMLWFATISMIVIGAIAFYEEGGKLYEKISSFFGE